MIRLIIVELKKIFKHKSIYLLFLVMFIFCFFNNLLFMLDYDSDGRYKYENDNSVNISSLEKELKKYDVNNSEDINIYVTTKSKIDVYNEMVKYNKNSWQYIKYSDYMYDIIYNINYYTYVIKDSYKLEEYNNKYNLYSSYFKDNNYKYFLDIEKKDVENKIKEIQDNLNSIKDKEISNKLERELNSYKDSLLVLDYRINNGIDYGNNYLNRALVIYGDNLSRKRDIINNKVEYNKVVRDIYVNKYIVDNKVNINKANTLSNGLRDISLDYELFIVIVILMVSSFMIGEEFNKGTIKLLLIKPYKRTTILISKIITGIVMVIISILFLIVCEIILGGLFLGFVSLNIPVVIYNFSSNKLVVYNIFIYMFIKIIARFGIFLFILLISFLLNIISGNSIFGFSVGMIMYSLSSVINNLIVSSNIKVLRYMFSLNWDFSNYLFGGISNFRYLSFKNSLLIYGFYVIIILTMMIIIFRNKDVKNV